MPTFNIDNVEIFAAGTWNGDTYTERDLDEMVQGFHDHKSKIRPFLKLGHDQNQKLLQVDGMPAAGWISDLKRVGNKLVAQFSDVPSKIYELIKNKAYRKVSSEIYKSIEINGKQYNNFLSAVALLGSDMPAVTNLDSILGMFKSDEFATIKSYASDKNNITIKEYQFENEKGTEMPDQVLEHKLREAEKKVEKLEADKQKFSQDLSKQKADFEKAQSELAELKKFKKKQEQKAAELAAKAEKAERENQWNDLEKQGLPKSAKEYTLALLDADKKEYSFDDKKLKRFEVLGKILKLFKEASEVNFDENSEVAEFSSQKQETKAREVETYMKENKCDYSTALKAVGM